VVLVIATNPDYQTHGDQNVRESKQMPDVGETGAGIGLLRTGPRATRSAHWTGLSEISIHGAPEVVVRSVKDREG